MFSGFLSHPVVAIILLLGLLILVHEAGHCLVGKLCRVPVEIFSIGFGPVLFRVRGPETEYCLSAIPLGGYVKFYGATPRDTVPDELKGREYLHSPVWVRALIIFAGPFANFLLAAVTYTIMGFHGIPQLPPVVGEITQGSPAEKIGLKFQDRILEINNKKIRTWYDLQQMVADSPGKSLQLNVDRDGKPVVLQVTPLVVNNDDGLGMAPRGQIGITPGAVPAVVTVADKSKRGARAGLLTGDKVVTVSYAGHIDQPIEYWQQFLMHLERAKASDKNIQIKVVNLFTAKESKTENSRIINLSLADLPTQQFDAEAVLKFLGLQDSQLTVKEVQKNHDQNIDVESDTLENTVDTHNTVKTVTCDFFRAGDVLKKWNGLELKDIFQFWKVHSVNKDSHVLVQILRDGKLVDVNMLLERADVQKAEGRVIQYKLPVVFLGELIQPPLVTEKYGLLGSIRFGVEQTFIQTVFVAKAVAGLFTGAVPLKALGGPISIGKVASDSVKLGWMTFFTALAMISINLGLLNLFPIPVLDGGQIVLLGAEWLHRKPLPESAIESFQKIGFVMVLALVVIATYNDLSRFWISMVQGLMGFFNG